MRGRKIDPVTYTAEMKLALEVILKERDPKKSSSQRAALALYREIRKLMPNARAKEVGAEAIWIGREEYPAQDEELAWLRDRAIRKAISVPLAIDREKKVSALVK
ncbi:hypothetical protein PXK01_16890 [Phaeobacter sp. PT47_59]|uniref:hypothetical protein n=1 Tax=Phaeobacter sp. PT47_59 TaxID=3029979 RepID=UPI00237FEB62|nr:hypothetical protein [Phaeobacter sp. PT47_59]MDE4175840.1 hypothetical protein [Phaeobacter sp. PT47_59]